MREQLIQLITSDIYYRDVCKKINRSYADDLFQEVVLSILTMPDDKLPHPNYLRFWFYRVASSTMTKTGRLGFVVDRIRFEELSGDVKQSGNQTSENRLENIIKEAEKFMLSLSEFENRIVLLYNELGDMKAVQRATGISYSALRSVKEKIKKQSENINSLS